MIVLEVVAGVVGVFLLGRSGAVFVGSASRLALRLGVSSIVVGIVVIGFGTSAPELVVSAVAAFEGSADVGVGNVVGSNLSNLTLVLGIAAVAAPLRVSSSLLRREAPLMFASMVMFGIFVQRGLTRLEGLLLLGTLAALTLLLVRAARAARQPSSTTDAGEDDGTAADETAPHVASAGDTGLTADHLGTTRRDVAIVMVGLAGTLGGAQLLVWAATGLADRAGLSGGIVGLTLVAVGTSLPEMATTLEAARQGDSDMIIGTLFGSNVINSLAAGAAVGLIAPSAVVDPTVIGAGVVIMLASALSALALMRRGFVLTRREGAMLIIAYVIAVTLLA